MAAQPCGASQAIQEVWESLRIQLTPTNQNVATTYSIFSSWDANAIRFILQSYYNSTGKMGIFILDGSMTTRVFLSPAECFLGSPFSSVLPPPVTLPSAPVLPSVSVFPATTTLPNHLSSSSSSATTYNTSISTHPSTNTNTIISAPPTNTPIYLNPIAAAPPRNVSQLRAAPPHSKLQFSASLPNEFLLHITQGQGVPRRTLKRTVERRPLNSWMAFRSYYSLLFTNLALSQKNASPLVKRLWQHDTSKAKWAVVARAYSSIRDVVGKPNAPLRAFLEMVIPEIGIICVDMYLDQMGWHVAEVDGSVSLQQKLASSPSLFNTKPIMSHKDVIHFCGARGYISPQNAALAIRGTGRVMSTSQAAMHVQGVLASVPQPTTTAPLPSISATSHATSFNDLESIRGTSAAGIDQMLEESLSYPWSGSLSDMDNFVCGLDNYLEPLITSANGSNSDMSWYKAMEIEPIDISNPKMFDAMLGNLEADYHVPFVPDDDAEPRAFM
ncbi:mating-type protein MAT alpha 1-domain-containing protein [Tricladium varicosporioides]|nr:mating-type protein MAT alpha 1-domain-containing protein [Hymenoscyphus varicosporioides]